jgi:hypothetical protein
VEAVLINYVTVCETPPAESGRGRGLQEEQDEHEQEKWEGNKRARVTRGSRNPKHGKHKHDMVHKPSRFN